jgi:hypothetical protein
MKSLKSQVTVFLNTNVFIDIKRGWTPPANAKYSSKKFLAWILF